LSDYSNKTPSSRGFKNSLGLLCSPNINFHLENDEFWRSWASGQKESYSGSFCSGFGWMMMIHIRDLAKEVQSLGVFLPNTASLCNENYLLAH
jgi:hypothetical protein